MRKLQQSSFQTLSEECEHEEVKEEEEEPSLSLSNMHDSILQQILARLHFLCLPSCSLVCKRWRLLISSSPSFARLHASLHSDRTWFTLYTSPSRNSMLVYDTIAERPVTRKFLKSADETPENHDVEDIMAALTAQFHVFSIRHIYGRLYDGVQRGKQRMQGEELLATAEGLVFSVSRNGSFTVTNIVTRKKKLLPSPTPPIRHLAFVGMVYFWSTMSYQILLCGISEAFYNMGQPVALITSMYNSLTGLWTNAASTFPSESFMPYAGAWSMQPEKDHFMKPRTCTWFNGRFYAVMDRTLQFFDMATMAWGKLYSLLPHRMGVIGEGRDKIQVWLPPNLMHLFCLWERKGELLVAGSVKNKESQNVTEVWRLVPSLREAASMASRNGSVMFAWEHFAHVPAYAFEADESLDMPARFEGKQRYACGDILCQSIIDELDLEDYMQNRGNFKGPHEECQVQFYIYNLATKEFFSPLSIPITTIVMDLCFPANLAMKPCPFTNP